MARAHRGFFSSSFLSLFFHSVLPISSTVFLPPSPAPVPPPLRLGDLLCLAGFLPPSPFFFLPSPVDDIACNGIFRRDFYLSRSLLFQYYIMAIYGSQLQAERIFINQYYVAFFFLFNVLSFNFFHCCVTSAVIFRRGLRLTSYWILTKLRAIFKRCFCDVPYEWNSRCRNSLFAGKLRGENFRIERPSHMVFYICFRLKTFFCSQRNKPSIKVLRTNAVSRVKRSIDKKKNSDSLSLLFQ